MIIFATKKDKETKKKKKADINQELDVWSISIGLVWIVPQ